MRPRSAPSPDEIVGRLHLVLGRDGCTYLRWHAESEGAVALGRVVAAAAVDWATRVTVISPAASAGEVPGWGGRTVSRYLERVCSSATAELHGGRVGVDQLSTDAPPAGTVGPSVMLDVSARPAGGFVFRWRVPSEAGTVSGSERTLASLWMFAEAHGQGEVVHHALYALRGGYERSGPFPAEVVDDLVASLLLFGADMHATDQRAQQARARLRVI